MTEIPEDVMKAARALRKRMIIEGMSEHDIARAIMTAKAEATAAERERAAKVAEDYKTSEEPFPGHAIAAAIRRGDA